MLLGGVKRAIGKRALSILGPMVVAYVRSSLESGEQGEGARVMWQRFVKFMDGKKTVTGAALIALPIVVPAVANAYLQAGGDPVLAAKIAAYSGGVVLFVVGVAHKVVKWLDDLTPDQPQQ